MKRKTRSMSKSKKPRRKMMKLKRKMPKYQGLRLKLLSKKSQIESMMKKLKKLYLN